MAFDLDLREKLENANFAKNESVPLATFWEFANAALFIADPSRKRDRSWPVEFECMVVGCDSKTTINISHDEVAHLLDKGGGGVVVGHQKIPQPLNWKRVEVKGSFPDFFTTPHFLCDLCSGARLKRDLTELILDKATLDKKKIMKRLLSFISK